MPEQKPENSAGEFEQKRAAEKQVSRMMGRMDFRNEALGASAIGRKYSRFMRKSRSSPWRIAVLGSTLWLTFAPLGTAQVNYVSRFLLEKEQFLVGEPIFCTFSIQNTGTRPFEFSYRLPSRALNPELEQEPRFKVRDSTGRLLPDPAPKPCGGARGSVVYGSVSLPPGQVHTERWLLNQWARFVTPGRYRLLAERRLSLLALDPTTGKTATRPVAYALAINELALEVVPATEAQVEGVLQPYVKMLDGSSASNLAEAILVVTTLPQPVLLKKLEGMARAPAAEGRWDRKQALEGLARLDTPAAWDSILRIASGVGPSNAASQTGRASSEDKSLRAYAILLLGEKADKSFLATLLEMASTAPEELRDDALRALGFFHDSRANQVLFSRLHSARPTDRVNAILGLRNLESKDVIPALLAMLKDPESQVRQVANFALENLTGQKFKMSARPSPSESTRVAEQWHAWWREKGATMSLAPQPPCHDW